MSSPPSSSSPLELEDDYASTIRAPALDFSDNEDQEGEEDQHEGDYSTRMEELMDSDEEDKGAGGEDSEEDEGGFIYEGVDAADASTNYRDQLRDVLGPDHEEDEEELLEEQEVEKSLIHDDDNPQFFIEEAPHGDMLSDNTPSSSSTHPSLPMTPPRVASPSVNGTPSRLSKPFLHPTVSRLRSYTPQGSREPSHSGSFATFHSQIFDGIASPSHFSAMSRTSSTSNLRHDAPEGYTKSEREVFRWTQLRNLGHHIYGKTSSKASAVLGAIAGGYPMVLAANGLICVGTDTGRIFVFDFKQTLKCVCGNDASAKTVGPVTAVSLSHDHTYVASGHATGHILLYDLNNPQTPARSVPPTSITAVSSGRQEGHLAGSRIISIGFVAGRHTAVVSADEHGLAFYHSLGKVLFVDASDTLRILGKYPDEEISSPPRPLQNGAIPHAAPFRRRRTRYTILDMMPLPLGTAPHPTDAYNVVAMLTPAKLVVVGLKPTPKTWFKCPRNANEENGSKSRSRVKGAMSWWPSVWSSATGKPEQGSKKNQVNGNGHSIATPPTLAYSWGNTLRIIRICESKVKQPVRNSRSGKTSEVEVGTIVFEEAGKWSTDEDIFALQWLNANQIVVLTTSHLNIYDVNHSKLVERVNFDPSTLVSPSLSSTINGAIPYADSVGDVAHSVRVYKGKIFLLGRQELTVGTLLTWADRILFFVQDGDFLSAIDLTRSYYVGEAPGNRNGLPDDPTLRRDVIGEKMRELMVASARYAFSEDRMTDGTHSTPDGRGVDRTSLFEGLVSTCARACVALDDFDFLFEDLFQQYEDAGIFRIFLEQLEPFILDSRIRFVPPRITQRLVAMHAVDGHSDLAERLIWHIDPACLDINQAIILCQKHGLYDALIYVYTRALRDYVSPVVELLGLIRKVNQYRKSRAEGPDSSSPHGALPDDAALEPVIMNAYKIYPYLANVLSGLTYPSEEPLDADEAFQAKEDVYRFLFFGRSSVWPEGEGGKLVLTSDDEGGVEPTYPYARLLLRFDAESFLHSLDIAFEDGYLNDNALAVGRLVIVKILLEILSSSTDLHSSDVTLVNIFVARNVPKYPQYLAFGPTVLHNILVGLAEDPDPSTREDRQLAAEYLLSAYNPHESHRIAFLFEQAGFYRILRSWHRHERKWAPLISTYLQDPEIHSPELFDSVDDILNVSTKANHGTLPTDVLATISDALPQLLQASLTSTALLVEKHMPTFHEEALDALGPDADHERFIYLRYLLGPPHADEDEYVAPPRRSTPSPNVPQPLRHLYISLECQYHPADVIQVLKYIPRELLDWSEVMQICEDKEVYDAVVWASNTAGNPREALAKAEMFEKRLTLKLVEGLSSGSNISPDTAADVWKEVSALQSVGRIGISICLEHSRGPSVTELPLEDIWFQLLSSQVNCVQSVSAWCPQDLGGNTVSTETTELEQSTLSSLRSLVQDTFGALVSISSTRAVSFPRLFKRLVETATHIPSSAGTPYTEFRAILTGMLESYRSDGDMLIITKHLVDRDLFETVEECSRARVRGWAPSRGICAYCRKGLLDPHRQSTETNDAATSEKVIVSRTGAIYHSGCSPPED
ncbi:hypothetical protein PLICRDRAFT_27564 [Plicaturopsis crispa FD-325 SS-3]|nr:hypothetical protein PLICRDRAFT_27564 [Plicaturopsis crispa FD-325 SS-3]